ncbi:MAG: glycosyltransferase family 4 protein, partial [Proteobacteria bacterium]|nr:glycosyltransferase family 4 protein [Pseudomonadota bacterium]
SSDPHPAVSNDDRFKIACLSNFAWLRGVDRTAEIATVLRDDNRQDILFVMAGNMAMSRSLPGELGRVAKSGGSFQDYVGKMGLSDMFLFLGHVADPERVLAACDALIKPTREANPWGRDILEGLAAGKPVISIGSYSEFVEDGVTGILQKKFEAVEMAQRICALADNPDLAKRFGDAGRARVQNLCDGPARAKDLQTVWERLACE